MRESFPSDDEGAFLLLLRLIQAGDLGRLSEALRRRGPGGARFSSLAWRIDRPLLFYALADGRLDMAQALLDRGASLEERSTWGLSPASLCCQCPESEGLKALAWFDLCGAKRDFPAYEGIGAPALPNSGERDAPARWWLAHGAAKALRPELLKSLLQTPFPVLDASGATLWHWLAQGCLGSPDMNRARLCARAIADFGADPQQPDAQGLLPQDLLPSRALALYEDALLAVGSGARRSGRRGAL